MLNTKIIHTKLLLLYSFLTSNAIITINGFTVLHPRVIRKEPSQPIENSKQRQQRSNVLLSPPNTVIAHRSFFTLHSSSVSGDDRDLENTSSSSRGEEYVRKISPSMSYEEEANELISLLLRRHSSSSSSDEEDDENSTEIERLMKSLEDAHLPFDPRTSLNGPLYVALYQKGESVPFWEKYSQIRSNSGRRKNLKGQRYVTVVPQIPGDRGEEDTYDLTNYAELYGEALSIQASATCIRNAKQPAVVNSQSLSSPPPPPESENFLSNLFAMASAILSSSSSSRYVNKLLPTPHDFTVTVKGASFSLLGNAINFNVKGTGFLRVLYADPRLRIFTVPKDTTNEFVNEKAGLTVAQVRVDLVDPSFFMEDER